MPDTPTQTVIPLSSDAGTNAPTPNAFQPSPKLDARRHRLRVLKIVLAAALLTLILGSGVWLRVWIYPASTPIHFRGDMINAWRWGSFTVLNTRHHLNPSPQQPGVRGVTLPIFLHRLGDVYQRAARFPHTLDYPAWRLTVAASWVWLERSLYPKATYWRSGYMAGLLWFNTAIELFGFLAAFLLVRHWTMRRSQPAAPILSLRQRYYLRRSAPPAPSEHAPDTVHVCATAKPQSWKPWIMGVLAASLFWFNPNVIQSAHTWVQSDVYVVPFYLAALYLASVDLFFAAGIVIAFGSLLKGQLLFGAAMFILWPLCARRWLEAAEYAVGLFLAFGLGISLWLFAGVIDWWYLGGVLLAAVWAIGWIKLWRPAQFSWYYAALLALPAAVAALWPWWTGWARNSLYSGIIAAAWLVAGPWFFSRAKRWLYVAISLALALAVIALTMPTHWMWLKTGFMYGVSVRHYNTLALPNADGLGLILQDNFHWSLTEKVFTLHWPVVYVVNMRYLLLAVFVCTCLLCAAAAAWHDRRNNPRFLLAMVTPWITLFAFGPTMYERYLLWGSAMLVCTAVSFDAGFVLLGLLLAILSGLMTLAVQLGVNGPRFHHALVLIQNMEPGLAYAVVLAALVCLYGTMRPGRLFTEERFARGNHLT